MSIENELAMALERIAALERELERHEERTEGLSAEETYRRTKRYIAFNPQVWRRLKSDAQKAVESHGRFSIAKEFEQLREDGWLQRNEHEEYKCNNSYRACLTRFLIAEVPGLADVTAVRKSKIDRYFPSIRGVAA